MLSMDAGFEANGKFVLHNLNIKWSNFSKLIGKIYFTSLLISHKHECTIIMHLFDRLT